MSWPLGSSPYGECLAGSNPTFPCGRRRTGGALSRYFLGVFRRGLLACLGGMTGRRLSRRSLFLRPADWDANCTGTPRIILIGSGEVAGSPRPSYQIGSD